MLLSNVTEIAEDPTVGTGRRRLPALPWQEDQIVAACEGIRRRIPRGGVVASAHASGGSPYLLQDGWAMLERHLEDGRRHVIDFVIPGEIIGLDRIFFDCTYADAIALTHVTVTGMAPLSLARAISRDAEFAAAVLRAQLREQARMNERLVTLGKRSAYERTAYLLIELWHRLWQHGLADIDGYRFPGNQTVLADTLGLSTVHLNRMMQRLRRNNLVEMARGRVRIFDMAGLMQVACVDSTHLPPFVPRPRAPT